MLVDDVIDSDHAREGSRVTATGTSRLWFMAITRVNGPGYRPGHLNDFFP